MKLLKLASTSPRRIALLQEFYKDIPIVNTNYEEDNTLHLPLQELVMHHAKGKAQSVTEEGIIIAADTLVSCNNIILPKPKDETQAKEMLALISGKQVTVMTGVALKDGEELDVDYESTLVELKTLTQEEIESYVATKEPLDKAGAFTILGKGAVLIEKIDGCYTNVIGLPIPKLASMLKKKGISLLQTQ